MLIRSTPDVRPIGGARSKMQSVGSPPSPPPAGVATARRTLPAMLHAPRRPRSTGSSNCALARVPRSSTVVSLLRTRVATATTFHRRCAHVARTYRSPPPRYGAAGTASCPLVWRRAKPLLVGGLLIPQVRPTVPIRERAAREIAQALECPAAVYAQRLRGRPPAIELQVNAVVAERRRRSRRQRAPARRHRRPGVHAGVRRWLPRQRRKPKYHLQQRRRGP